MNVVDVHVNVMDDKTTRMDDRIGRAVEDLLLLVVDKDMVH